MGQYRSFPLSPFVSGYLSNTTEDLTLRKIETNVFLYPRVVVSSIHHGYLTCIYLCIYLTISVFSYLSLYQSIYLSIYLVLFISVCLLQSVHLSISFSLSLALAVQMFCSHLVDTMCDQKVSRLNLFFFNFRISMKTCVQLSDFYNKVMMSRCVDWCLDIKNFFLWKSTNS